MPAKPVDKFFGDVIEAIQNKCLKDIGTHLWVDYPHPRLAIGHDILEEAFAKIDRSKIIAVLTENIEDRLAKQLFNSLETEITNDIKLALSNKALRHGVRMAASIAIRDFIKKATEEE